jgi:uncharacterized membrane protein
MARGNKPTRQQVTISQAKFHQGPFPDPDTLDRYNQIQPGFAERIIQLAETEADHRRSVEKRVVNMNFILGGIGMIFGLIAIVGVLALCYYAFSLGYDTAAGAIATGVLIGIGGVFLSRNKSKS